MEERSYSSWMLERIAIGDTVRLRFGATKIGRHSSSDIRILDAAFVSRRHAIINVSNNGENVSLEDVSSNGIYVNNRRYDKATVQLKSNDLIGIGVSPNDIENGVDVLKLPIYELKHAPIRNLVPNRNIVANSTNFLPAFTSKANINSETDTKIGIKEEKDNNDDQNVQKQCCSKTIKVERLKEILSHEIVEISDDDDGDDLIKKPKTNEMDMITQQNHIEPEATSSENQQNSLAIINKQVELVIKNELMDENYINPSQKSREKISYDGTLNIEKDNNAELDISSSRNCLNHISNTKCSCNAEEIDPCQSTTSLKSLRNNEDKPLIHVPFIPNLKKERIRSISSDIQNIFGDIEGDVEIQKTIKELNPLVFNELNVCKKIKPLDGQAKMLKNGSSIVLTDEEDLEEVEVEELGTLIPYIIETKEQKNTIVEEIKKDFDMKKLPITIPITTGTNEKKDDIMEGPKSPNLFDYSLDNSKEEVETVEGNQNFEVQKTIDTIRLEEYTKYALDSDDKDIEDLMFSQVLINDMKAELQDDEEKVPLPSNTKNLSDVVDFEKSVIVKQEPGLEGLSSIPKELENSCWIISDDEDYDAELETKVNDWSNRIFSQSFNLLSQNMSQVFDIEEPDKNGSNEEDDWFEEDNLSLLEDDIEGIASIYTSIEDPDIDKKLKSINDEKKISEVQTFNELNNPPAKETIVKTNKTKEINELQEKLETEYVKEKSPVIQNSDFSNNIESPLIHKRRICKTNPVILSPSSSEDELDAKNQKIPSVLVVPEADKPITRLIPPVIEAPSLPKHKGKLKGVSAEVLEKAKLNLKSTFEKKTNKFIKEKIHAQHYAEDLKRKWLEKPSTTKKRDKEHKKLIKERRKDKLKELAERKNSLSKGTTKRKLSTEDHEHKAKVAKVKVTTHNRGAFLVNNDPTPLRPQPASHNHKAEQINQFKIPKIIKKSDEQTQTCRAEINNKHPLPCSLSVDYFETFSQQISKPDILLLKSKNSETKNCEKSNPLNKSLCSMSLREHSTAETNKRSSQLTNLKTTLPPPSSIIRKDSVTARATRTTNKITFASMERNIEKSEENKRKLSELNANNATKDTLTVKKKKVRFIDTPIIHYIERIKGAYKKINNKDVLPLTTYKDRRHLFRTVYPIVDHTDRIISQILCWSNEWLIKRNAVADAASDVIYPMPIHFNSFEHYKSIIFPLMKMEFVSALEREYNVTQKVKSFKVSLEYTTHNNDRIMLVTKFLSSQVKEFTGNILYDLVLLESDKGGPQIFAYVVANRKGTGTFGTIVYEIMAKNFTVEYFKAIKEFYVRPVMDKVRVHFGAFNSVYQLHSTPLFQKIINPLELLKCRSPAKRKVNYRGFDKLNDKQKQVLLNTYVKIIDEATPNITLIQGPPGTGKSRVITNLVLQTLYGEEVRYLDKKILICAQSNAAVDVIARKLYDISMRMRPEKRFRLIRYGILNKMHPNVLPVALQKVVEYDQLQKLQAKNKDMQIENKENLKQQILQFEAQVAEMSLHNFKGTVEENVLIEKKRQLQLMRNILNECIRPEDERSLYSWYLCNANIVCATLSSCVNLSQYINFFDICIIDEATQCTEPWTLLPLKFGINSLVLVGDTQQLPATVLSKKANELGLGTSMFTRIQQCLDIIPITSIKVSKANVTTPNNIIYSLQTQYRMHPEICRWPNQYFYRNELINDKSTIDLNKSPLVPFSILSLTYTQNSLGVDGKITNNLEAEFVAKLLKALDGFIPNKYNSYGVITPYAHHRATLESSIRNLGLTNIMVNTIDSYQGLEKNVIVISNARTNGIGFLSNPQRLNVALTRSKKCLILCGNFKNLESVPAWRCLLENARERNVYHEISANSIDDIQTNVIDKIKSKNQIQ